MSLASRSSRGVSRSLKPAPQQPITYTDAEEALEAGIEAEERGERVAVGAKAKKNYEEALTLYRSALRIDTNSADAAYNAARVLFVLASSFYMPTSKLSALQESSALYSTAYRIATAAETDGTDAASFTVDISSNLAATLQATADLLADEAEHPGILGLPEGTTVQQANEQALMLYQQALSSLQIVVQEQETVLAQQLRDELDALGQDTMASDGRGSTSNETTGAPADEAAAAPAAPNMDPKPKESHESTFAYASSLIVPSSLLESYVALFALHLRPLLHATSAAEVRQGQEALESIVARAHDFMSQCDRANDWGNRASAADDWSQAVSSLSQSVEEGECELLSKLFNLSHVAVQSSLTAAAEMAPGLQSDIVTLGQRLGSTLQGINGSKSQLAGVAAELPQSLRKGFYQMKVDEMISTADRAVSVARLLLRSSVTQTPPPPEATSDAQDWMRLSWSLATVSSQTYLLVTSLLDTSSGGPAAAAAVLGASQTTNPTTLLRCQVFTSLSSVSLLRSHAAYTALSSPAVVNASSRCTIVDNARVYSRRALSEVGLAWTMAAEEPLTPLAVRQTQAKYAAEVPPGGWDAIQTQAEAILTAARAVWARAHLRSTALNNNSSSEAGIQDQANKELSKLGSSVQLLCATGGYGTASQSELVLNGWRCALSAQRWVKDQLVEEEGMKIVSPEELDFWSSQWIY